MNELSILQGFKMIKIFWIILSITAFTAFGLDNHPIALTNSHIVELEHLIENNEKSESLKSIENFNSMLNKDHDSHKRTPDHKLVIDHAIGELKKVSEAVKKNEKGTSLKILKMLKEWLKVQK